MKANNRGIQQNMNWITWQMTFPQQILGSYTTLIPFLPLIVFFFNVTYWKVNLLAEDLSFA